MKTMSNTFGFRQQLLVLAIAAAFAPASYAEGDDVAEFTQPSSSVSVGLGGLTGDKKSRSIFGQYNGMRQDDAVGLFDIDIIRRDENTGTWTTLKGNNLGLDSRDISAGIEKQGDWKIGVIYDEITHREIRSINTANTGVGTTTPTVIRVATPGTGQDIDLKLRRQGTTLIGEKWLSPSLLFEFNFKNEDKDGARLSGKGYDCASYVCTGASPNTAVKNAILMQAEPVNTNTKQLDMKIVYSSEAFNGHIGYYGSIFQNENGSVNMTLADNFLYGGNGTTLNPLYGAAAGGTSLKNVLQLPFALAPDNQAHQVFAAGTYAFTKTTKATFKYAYTHATQDDSFAGMGLPSAPAGVGSLGGELNTNLIQIGLTSKPLQKLTINANIRYEDKDDKTPKYLYNIENTARWYNADISSKKLNGKLEASYLLPENFRATIGADYKEQEREVPTDISVDKLAGLSTVRAKNEELNYRAEISRMMSETLTGSIGYSTGYRRGSDWTSLATATYGQILPSTSFTNANFPLSMADVNREKWKLSVNWMPLEKLTVQFIVESGSDRNVTTASPTSTWGRGYRKNGNQLYSVDLAYSLSDNWELTGFASTSRQSLDINHSTYLLSLDNDSDIFGLGIKGKVTPRLNVGANAVYLNDNTRYGLQAAPGSSAANVNQAAIGVPDVSYRQSSFNLYGAYAMDKHSNVRLDLIHQEYKFNEWSWSNNGTPFVFADGTTVTMNPNQKVTFLGLTYIYKWQ